MHPGEEGGSRTEARQYSILEAMKLTAAVKLQPTPEQSAFLHGTLDRANAACDRISAVAWERRIFGQYQLHHAVYHDLKATSGLSAQVIVRCIAKVADAYKLDKRSQRTFRPTGAIAYDDRILRWLPDAVSIWTTGGRQTIPFVCGDHTRTLLASRQGESDLFTRDGGWFLAFTANVEEPPADLSDDWLGVDLGVVNLAADSDGMTYGGESVERARRTFGHRRRNLQRKGTRAAKRKLCAIKRRQARFQRDTNHRISKRIVATAQGTGRGIALEDLRGIRDRTRLRRRQRARHANWGFGQLRAFVSYKAAIAGVSVVLVDPRHTSQRCHKCGAVDKASRRSQAEFICTSCGVAAPADLNAARNIALRARAAVNRPNERATVQGFTPPG
jgi:IS605 OrfB family transposase